MAFGKNQRTAGGVSDDIGTSPDVIPVTSFTSQDLMAIAPAGASLPRGLLISNVGAGTKVLEVITAANQTRTIDATNLQGAYLPVCVKALTSNTTVTAVLLFY